VLETLVRRPIVFLLITFGSVVSLTELTSEDVVALDKAGAQGTRQLSAKTFIHRLVVVFLLGAVALGACGYLGIDVL
jgi:hypothetical protein